MHDPRVGDRLLPALPDALPELSFPAFPEFDETILDAVAPKRPGPTFLPQSPPIAAADGDPTRFRPERLDFRAKPINPAGPRRFTPRFMQAIAETVYQTLLKPIHSAG